MSVKNFIPKFWSAAVMRELEKQLVLVQRCNRNYEGLISAAGDTVKINGIGGIDVNAYTGADITFQEIEDASTFLLIDQKKYAAFKLDDVDRAQATAGIFEGATQEAAYALGDIADQFIAGKYTEAGISVTQADLDSANIISSLSKLNRAFEENNVPVNMPKWLVVAPWVKEKMLLGDIIRNTDNSGSLASGYIGNFMGFDVYVSNNLTTSGTEAGGDLNSKCMAGTMNAITYADQIVKMEAGRAEKGFSDWMKMLHVYGAKVVRPKELALFDVTIEAETAI